MEQMRNTFLLIQNIAVQSEVPDEVAEWIKIVGRDLDLVFVALEEGKVV